MSSVTVDILEWVPTLKNKFCYPLFKSYILKAVFVCYIVHQPEMSMFKLYLLNLTSMKIDLRAIGIYLFPRFSF